MIHSLIDEPAPQPPQVPSLLDTTSMVLTALARCREDGLPHGEDFGISVSFTDREIEVEWACQCGEDDCTGVSGRPFTFTELTKP